MKLNKLKRFEGLSISDDIIGFLSDFQNSKFKRYIVKLSNGKMSGNMTHDVDLVRSDVRYPSSCIYIKSLYDEGYGIKSIIKNNKLPITYPVLRKLMIDFMNIKLRKSNEVTDKLRLSRSNKVKSEHDGGYGWFSDSVIRKTNRGIQGYYFNISKNKYVWLRSTYEYIYADWLDRNKFIWDVEYKSYRMDDNSLYKPDFFIFNENGYLIKIVEIKGYWKNQSYKFFKLKDNIDIECEIINDDEILNYTNEKIITNSWRQPI